MLDVIWITVGDERVASSRVRAFELARELESHDVRSRVVVGSGLLGRMRATAQIIRMRPAVIVLQKVFYGRAMLAFVRRSADCLVVECDDAVQLGYPGQSHRARERLRRGLAAALKLSDVLTTSSPLLAAELGPNSERVVWFAGPAPQPTSGRAEREKVALWLGSPSTSPNLDLLGELPMHEQLADWDFVAVGANGDVAAHGWQVVPWSADNAREWLARAAVGVMPQSTSPWDDRKAGYKLLQYAAAGVVPVASDVAPARMLVAGTDVEPLLVGEGDWARAILRGWDDRPGLLPALAEVAGRFAVDRCAQLWLEAVTERASR